MNETPVAYKAGDGQTQNPSGGWALHFRNQREALGLTQTKMAELLACGEKSYCRWENGAEPTPMVIRLLQCVIALKKIMRVSHGGCYAGDCLNCGEVNELAFFAIGGPSVPEHECSPAARASSENPAPSAELEEIAREARDELFMELDHYDTSMANFRDWVAEIILTALTKASSLKKGEQ